MKRTKKTYWTARELCDAAEQISRLLKWDLADLERFHHYAQRFGGVPGGSVYNFVLKDALRLRGMTLEQFDKEQPK